MVDNFANDRSTRWLPLFWSWGLPLAILFSTDFLSGLMPQWSIVAVLSGAFFWMGAACLQNARRCHRRHCYYSGPIFIIGAIAVLLVGLKVILIGRDGLNIVMGVTFGLVLLTYLSEVFFGKYVTDASATD